MSCTCMAPKRNITWWRIGMGFLAVFAFASFAAQFAAVDGQSNMWSNAKSMHFTRNYNALTWFSIFPSRVYLENEQAQMYRTVDGVLDKLTPSAPSAPSTHGFQIAGGFGILTNISTHVYFSALLVVYFLSAMDSAWSSKGVLKAEKHIYYQWATVTAGVVFVLAHLFTKFSLWTQLDWGDAVVTPVTYSWEAGYSLLYAVVVVVLYVVHVNVKHGLWQPIVAAVADHTNKEQVDIVHGPKSKESSVVFAATFFLLAMAVLGNTRSIVLETEAQLVVICAASVAVITLLSMRVRAYFQYVSMLLVDKEKAQHKNMMEHALLLVDVLTLAVTALLYAVTLHVLLIMYLDNPDMLLFTFGVFCGLFVFLKVLEFGYEFYAFARDDKHAHAKWFEGCFACQYVATILIIIIFSWVQFFLPHPSDPLRKMENSQFLGMHTQALKPNSNCAANGVQSNGLLLNFLKLKTDTKFDAVSTNSNNPVNFKVWAWTRWWQLQPGKGTTQDAQLFLCSLGMEQVFGACREQYATIPGKALDTTFLNVVNTVALDTAPA